MTEAQAKPTIYINPPPSDRCCEGCGKNSKDLQPFGGAGDPLVGDFTGALLVKTFRDPGTGWIGASWECRDCIGLDDEVIREMQIKRWKEKARQNQCFGHIHGTHDPECHTCAVEDECFTKGNER